MQNALLEHSAILSTSIKRVFVIKTFVLSNFEWPLNTDFTVFYLTKYRTKLPDHLPSVFIYLKNHFREKNISQFDNIILTSNFW